jgi:hypothetical protein
MLRTKKNRTSPARVATDGQTATDGEPTTLGQPATLGRLGTPAKPAIDGEPATDGEPAADGQPTTHARPVAPGRSATAGLAPREAPGGGTQLLTDARIVALIATEARDRTMWRLFGLSKDDAALAGLIFLALAARSANNAGKQAVSQGPKPTVADGVIAVTTARELLLSAAGLPPDTPVLATLLVGAVAFTTARRLATKSRHAIRSSSSQASAGFHHRYGYLVDPGHWRQHRAMRRVAAATSAVTDATSAVAEKTAAVAEKTAAVAEKTAAVATRTATKATDATDR